MGRCFGIGFRGSTNRMVREHQFGGWRQPVVIHGFVSRCRKAGCADLGVEGLRYVVDAALRGRVDKLTRARIRWNPPPRWSENTLEASAPRWIAFEELPDDPSWPLDINST